MNEAQNALLSASKAKSRAQAARYRAEQIEAMIESLRSIDYSVQRVSGSRKQSDKTEELIDRLEATAGESRDAAQDWLREMERARLVLDRMDDQEHAAILDMHYLAGASWLNTATAFGYSGPGIYDVRKKALIGYYRAMIEWNAKAV